MITRDSCALDRANFQAAQTLLTEAKAEFETIRRGHWGPGWYEIIVVRPTPAGRQCLEKLESRLEDYPVLDEDLWSELETEDACEAWSAYAESEFVGWLVEKHGLSESTVEFLESHTIPVVEYETVGPEIHFERGYRAYEDRSAVADLLLTMRRDPI